MSEKILATKSGQDVSAGDIVVCEADLILGTDASTPMALEYFQSMNGARVAGASKVFFGFDHYVPPSTAVTARFQAQVRSFARTHGIEVSDVGEGISFQVACEVGRVVPGDLVIGADSHTVTCGALNAFATGVGSSDLAGALLTSQVWLRVPPSIRVVLTGTPPPGVAAKDIALELVGQLGSEGAAYHALEFAGPALADLTVDDRLVLSNMAVETGAKAAIFPADEKTAAYLRSRASRALRSVTPDANARYARQVELDLSRLEPRVARPHAPDNVVDLKAAAGQPIDMVFLGTCTGGRVEDLRQALGVLERGGGIARGVQVVVTPASREVYLALLEDGTIARLAAMGAVITTPGCGPCCGTSGPIPADGMNVLSTANRNFKARMGNATADIYLASPAACAAAAVTGEIADPRVYGA